jgi:ribosome-associated protein
MSDKRNPSEKTATVENLIHIIGEALLDRKAEEIRLLDVRKVTTLTDYFVVCHGLSDTQVKAIADNVIEQAKKTGGEYVWKKEGHDTNRWIVLDFVHIVVHIFLKDLRQYYGIEKMWSDAIVTEIRD